MTAALSCQAPLAPEGLVFLLPLAGVTRLVAFLGWRGPAGVGLILAACVAFLCMTWSASFHRRQG